MEELKEKTSDVLYENYRSDKLMSMGVEQDQTVFKEVKYQPLPLQIFSVHQLITCALQSRSETRGRTSTPSSQTSKEGIRNETRIPTKSSGKGTKTQTIRGGIICTTPRNERNARKTKEGIG